LELNEKIQELRKRKGLTQEELAGKLYVSRTAVSKWESGRGVPNIESLKAISAFFQVTLDDLLSGDELLEIAEDDRRQREARSRDMVFGLLDCCMALLFFLPFFAVGADGAIRAVSLLGLTGLQPYLQAAYSAVVVCMAGCGLATLALQNCARAFWLRNKGWLSLLLNAIGVILFILGRQPYAAVFALALLMIKALLLLRQR